MLPAMVQHMHFLRVIIDTGCLVADEGVLVPAIPQTVDHFGELGGAIVAVGMRRMLVPAMVECFGLVVGGHQVPSGAAGADLVQRGKLAGQR